MTGWISEKRRPLLIATAVLGAVLAAAAGALAVKKFTEDDGCDSPVPQTTKKTMWGPPFLADGTTLFPEYKKLGVGIFAIQARWEEIAPTEPENPTNWRDPAYEWPQYLTDQLREAGKYGLKTQLLVMGTPKWANGGQEWNWMPDDPQDYTDFVTAAASKYPDVNLWQIWGEPNRAPNFSPLTPVEEGQTEDYELNAAQQEAPRNYAIMLDAAYEALKEDDPRNLVIGGNTYTSAGYDNIRPYQWIEYLRLPDGSRPRMDMWGHNPWGHDRPDLDGRVSPNGTVSFNDLGRLVKHLDRADFPGKPLKVYLAEWGVATGFEDKDLLQDLPPDVANKWISSGFNIAKWKRIYTLGWVHPTDTDRNSTGLMTESGEPKTSYETYKCSGE